MRNELGVLALAALVVAGCAAGQGKPATDAVAEQEPAPPATAEELPGRAFTATSVTEEGKPRALVAGTELTVEFGLDGGLGAAAGCNQMVGQVTATADTLDLPETLVSTLKACDEARTAQDTWLTGLLTADPGWRLEGSRLTLTSGDTTIELDDTTEPNPPLAGTSWTVANLDVGAPEGLAPAKPVTLTFGADTVEIDTGCNTGTAGYTTTATTIRFEPPTLTRMGCDPPVMAVEQALVSALTGEVRHQVRETRLTIAHPDGVSLDADRNPR